MQSAFEIRVATEADLLGIAEIERASFARPEERLSARTMRALVRNKRASCIVAEGAESQLLGWAAGFIGGSSAARWGRVYAVAVHPEGRGLGLGEALLRRLIEMLEARRATRIFLEVRENNPAIRLYRRVGFEPCDSLADYYGRGVHAHRMVRGSSS